MVGESLPKRDLQLSINHSVEADLFIVLGSSLLVSPACNLPQMCVERGGSLVIVNLQNTPLDNIATLRVYSRIDTFLNRVLLHLEERRETAISTEADWSLVPEWKFPLTLVIGNLHELCEQENLHRWTMVVFVRYCSTDHPQLEQVCTADIIKSVTFTLHPTFEQSEVTAFPQDSQGIVNCSDVCSITRIGWGTFVVRLLIEFTSECELDPVQLDHELNFEKSETLDTFQVSLVYLN